MFYLIVIGYGWAGEEYIGIVSWSTAVEEMRARGGRFERLNLVAMWCILVGILVPYIIVGGCTVVLYFLAVWFID